MECNFAWWDMALFEFKSFLGRRFLKTTPALNSGKNYLNLGCGDNIVDGYINADFFYGYKFWKKRLFKKEWQLDLRYPLDCQNDVFDGVYTEHALEHLTPCQVKNLLRELYRVMKDQAVIRITVPDIQKYVNFYNGSRDSVNVEEFDKRFDSGCSAIHNVTQNHIHLSVWDYEELKNCLETAGFSNVREMSFGNSQDEKLKIDIETRSWETLYIEAVKIMKKNKTEQEG